MMDGKAISKALIEPRLKVLLPVVGQLLAQLGLYMFSVKPLIGKLTIFQPSPS